MSAATATQRSATRRRPCWNGTPEIYFSKSIDNSRLVKLEDPRRTREMRQFSVALCFLFVIVMMYAWQHFKAIEYGYKIADLKALRVNLTEANRGLQLEEAMLRDPQRIDQRARQMGLQSPEAGQIVALDSSVTDTAVPVMASVSTISVVATQ